ncbi:MAG: YdcF family protein [Oscillospiraceae bacterium]|nr:YdcF family protein [Oscillospiraceae bacterium]
MTEKKQKYLYIRIILFLLGVLSLLNTAFLFRISNPTIGFALQGALSVALLAYAVCLPWISKKIHIILGVLCLIPAGFTLFLAIYGNVSNADYTEEAIVVLGAGIHGERVSRPLAHRLDTAAAYWRENPTAYIVVTGGLGNRAIITEAEAMARYLIRIGVPEERILLEELSTSTYENLVFAQEILDEHFPGGYRVVVVTNDFHLYRATLTARRVGLDVARLGAPTDWYSWPSNYLREMVAVVNQWVFGGG